MTIWNLGSVNADHIYEVPHLPGRGETILATSVSRGLGGKGANMAVASARAGARVELIGGVGQDGLWMRDRLAELGVGVGRLEVIDGPSGQAIVAVEPGGENQIFLYPGTNLSLDPDGIAAALSGASAGDLFVCQNETTQQAAAARVARDRGLRVTYAAAPFSASATEELLPFTDLLILNEVEAEQLSRHLGQAVEELPVGDIVITLGAQGCRWIVPATGARRDFAAVRVDPVDTTGAGDTFTGYLLAGLDLGRGMEAAIGVALAAAALKVTRKGTADAIPSADEVTAFRAGRGLA